MQSRTWCSRQDLCWPTWLRRHGWHKVRSFSAAENVPRPVRHSILQWLPQLIQPLIEEATTFSALGIKIPRPGTSPRPNPASTMTLEALKSLWVPPAPRTGHLQVDLRHVSEDHEGHNQAWDMAYLAGTSFVKQQEGTPAHGAELTVILDQPGLIHCSYVSRGELITPVQWMSPTTHVIMARTSFMKFKLTQSHEPFWFSNLLLSSVLEHIDQADLTPFSGADPLTQPEHFIIRHEAEIGYCINSASTLSCISSRKDLGGGIRLETLSDHSKLAFEYTKLLSCQRQCDSSDVQTELCLYGCKSLLSESEHARARMLLPHNPFPGKTGWRTWEKKRARKVHATRKTTTRTIAMMWKGANVRRAFTVLDVGWAEGKPMQQSTKEDELCPDHGALKSMTVFQEITT